MKSFFIVSSKLYAFWQWWCVEYGITKNYQFIYSLCAKISMDKMVLKWREICFLRMTDVQLIETSFCSVLSQFSKMYWNSDFYLKRSFRKKEKLSQKRKLNAIVNSKHWRKKTAFHKNVILTLRRWMSSDYNVVHGTHQCTDLCSKFNTQKPLYMFVVRSLLSFVQEWKKKLTKQKQHGKPTWTNTMELGSFI